MTLLEKLHRICARLNDPKDRRVVRLVCVALIAFELVLSSLIVFKVNYTEIDWKAYLEEVHGYVQGERDYTKLRGGTGPLVYPAGFVYVYRALYGLVGGLKGGVTPAGIAIAQRIFVGIYCLNQAIVFGIYEACEILPPWAYLILCLSKRIHSVFVLRMFNDSVAMAVAYAAVMLFQRKKWVIGSCVLSLGVSIKMNVLLFMPGLLVLLVGGTKLSVSILSLAVFVATQIFIAAPFLLTHPREYVSRAFEIGRVFTHKWSVNFKFVDESVFVSKEFASFLLTAHLCVLFLFAHRKWCRQNGGFFFSFFKDFFKRAVKNIDGNQHTFTPAHVAIVLAESNFIGVVFARSLHYQFYSWYYHTLPLLLWSSSRSPTYVKLITIAAIEYCWNVYPSTATSSEIFIAIHSALLIQLALAYPKSGIARNDRGKEKAS